MLMTTIQTGRLKELERTIQSTSGAFVACGNALREIRDSKLYLSNHKSFEDYCRKRWGWGRSRAYDLIEAASIKVSPVGDTISNFKQARAIARVPEPQRAAVIERASNDGKLTVRKIEQAAREPDFVVQLDEIGRVIPEYLIASWQLADSEAKELLSKMREVTREIKSLIADNEPRVRTAGLTNVDIADFEKCVGHLQSLVPYTVCPTCQGRTGCNRCRKAGWINKSVWKLIPEDEQRVVLKSISV